MDVIFKYEDNIEIIWNGFGTFNVFNDGKNVDCFTDFTVRNSSQAEFVADEWLYEKLEEEKLRYADAY